MSEHATTVVALATALTLEPPQQQDDYGHPENDAPGSDQKQGMDAATASAFDRFKPFHRLHSTTLLVAAVGLAQIAWILALIYGAVWTASSIAALF